MRTILVFCLVAGLPLVVAAVLSNSPSDPGQVRDDSVAVSPAGNRTGSDLNASEESCVDCHRRRQPGLMAQWDGSAHDLKGVSCEDCHRDDHEVIFADEGQVDASRCANCHAQETEEFANSVHAHSLSSALANARLMAQIPAMQRAGCLGCHNMGPKKLDADNPHSEQMGRCNSCHGAHRFSSADARRPEACGSCHMGPDHPHIEAWEASKHGVVYQATHDEEQAPTCATCHMPKGTHDVSGGITIGRAGSGAVLKGETPPIPMRVLDPEKVKEERDRMLAICQQCHTPRVARRALEDADAIKREADRLVAEAVRIVKGLYDDQLLDPMPEERPPHPTAGHELVLGGQMLYEHHSTAERIFFDLAKFAHAITFKGAYHQSPDHTHWLGIVRLKEDLEALKAEERRLRANEQN